MGLVLIIMQLELTTMNIVRGVDFSNRTFDNVQLHEWKFYDCNFSGCTFIKVSFMVGMFSEDCILDNVTILYK